MTQRSNANVSVSSKKSFRNVSPRIPVRIAGKAKATQSAFVSSFVVVLRREVGKKMQYCSAQTIDEARLYGREIMRRDLSVLEVMMLAKATNAPLGSVKANDPAWYPPSEFPTSRMTWH